MSIGIFLLKSAAKVLVGEAIKGAVSSALSSGTELTPEQKRENFCRNESANLTEQSEYYKSNNWLRANKIDPNKVQIMFFKDAGYLILTKDTRYFIAVEKDQNDRIYHMYFDPNTEEVAYIFINYPNGTQKLRKSI